MFLKYFLQQSFMVCLVVFVLIPRDAQAVKISNRTSKPIVLDGFYFISGIEPYVGPRTLCPGGSYHDYNDHGNLNKVFCNSEYLYGMPDKLAEFRAQVSGCSKIYVFSDLTRETIIEFFEDAKGEIFVEDSRVTQQLGRTFMIKDKNEMIRLLNALFPDVKIYLFGSRARGDHKPTSDIDLALDTGAVVSIPDLAKAKNVLNALYVPQKINVVDLNSVPEVLRSIILKEGKEWKIQALV